jgi:flagellin-like hook-associated protein FlgL
VRQTNHNVASAATVSQIVEAGLGGARQVLQRLFQVSLRAQEASISDGERRQLQTEVSKLRHELAEMSSTAKFSGIPLLNGAQRALTFQLGMTPQGGEVHLGLTDVRPETVVPGVDAQAVSTPESSRAAAEVIGEAMDAIQVRLDKIGGFRERLQLVVDDGRAEATEEDSKAETVRAAEDAAAMMARAQQQILLAPTTSLLTQVSLISQEAMALIRP